MGLDTLGWTEDATRYTGCVVLGWDGMGSDEMEWDGMG